MPQTLLILAAVLVSVAMYGTGLYLWWLPGHREAQALKAAAQRRNERLRRRVPGRAA